MYILIECCFHLFLFAVYIFLKCFPAICPLLVNTPVRELNWLLGDRLGRSDGASSSNKGRHCSPGSCSPSVRSCTVGKFIHCTLHQSRTCSPRCCSCRRPPGCRPRRLCAPCCSPRSLRTPCRRLHRRVEMFALSSRIIRSVQHYCDKHTTRQGIQFRWFIVI